MQVRKHNPSVTTRNNKGNIRMALASISSQFRSIVYRHMKSQETEENSTELSQADVLLSMYKQYDTDGNGTLDKAEFLHSIYSMKIQASAEEADLLFKFFDKDGSGDLDYHEFVALVLSGQAPSAAVGRQTNIKLDLKTMNKRLNQTAVNLRRKRITKRTQTAGSLPPMTLSPSPPWSGNKKNLPPILHGPKSHTGSRTVHKKTPKRSQSSRRGPSKNQQIKLASTVCVVCAYTGDLCKQCQNKLKNSRGVGDRGQSWRNTHHHQ